MHRTFQVHLPADRTSALVRDLNALDDVIGLALFTGDSEKPKGDMLTIHLLNTGADDVLRSIQHHCQGTRYLVTTAMNDSLVEISKTEQLENDVDEAIWEEMETGLRHHGRVSTNFVALMALGGVLASIGLVSDPAPQAMAFVAAAVIAPGFEPLAKIALGTVLGQWPVVKRGLWSSLVGYAVLIAAAALGFWIMQQFGATSPDKFLQNPEVKSLSSPTAKEIMLSICGTLAGALIVASFRKSVIAGALIAMVIIHAGAMIGVALVIGRPDLALEGAERFGLDIVLILASCSLVFFLKQQFFHKRKPIV